MKNNVIKEKSFAFAVRVVNLYEYLTEEKKEFVLSKQCRKCVLINYQKLAQLTGFATYDAFQKAHKELVSESLANDNNSRQTKWTESIAVGNKGFIETIKEQLGILASGRKVLETNDGFQLREEVGTYIANSDIKNDDIAPQNTYFWSINP